LEYRSLRPDSYMRLTTELLVKGGGANNFGAWDQSWLRW